MNYFGHAALASHCSRSPGFILGSMLPDLCAMVGVNLKPDLHPELRSGLEFHLATDAVFHQTEMFLTHNQRVLLALRDQGIRRGPARACAHMGVEMLIDAVLVESEAYLGAYKEALYWGADHGLDSGSIQLGPLFLHLADRGGAVFESSFSRLSDRFKGALTHRPRLAPSDSELSTIALYLASDPLVRRDVPALLTQLQRGFQAAWPTMTELAMPKGGISKLGAIF